MVSGLTFRSSILFEFIFVYGVRKWSSDQYKEGIRKYRIKMRAKLPYTLRKVLNKYTSQI